MRALAQCLSRIIIGHPDSSHLYLHLLMNTVSRRKRERLGPQSDIGQDFQGTLRTGLDWIAWDDCDPVFN